MQHKDNSGGLRLTIIPHFMLIAVVWALQNGNTAVAITLRVWKVGLGINFSTYE